MPPLLWCREFRRQHLTRKGGAKRSALRGCGLSRVIWGHFWGHLSNQKTKNLYLAMLSGNYFSPTPTTAFPKKNK